MDCSPAGRYLCLDDLSTSSRPTLVCCRAASTPSSACSRDVTSCSWFTGILLSDPVFGLVPAPGLLKHPVSSLASREACALAIERSCCSIASRWFEFPTEFPAAAAAAAEEVRSLDLRRSRVSLRRPSSCKAILLPAVSTATPQEPPYWATNLIKRTSVKDLNHFSLNPPKLN